MVRHVTRPCPCMTTSIIINITRVISMWTLHWITVGCSGVGSPMTTGYYCAIFPFCGGGKKKKKTTKKQWHFNWATTSGASDWQACKDSHRNKRRTFVFHKIVIYNPWTWKQCEYSLKISLTPKRSKFTGVQKLFLLWREIGNKIDHYISYRVFFLCEARKGAGD